MIIGDKLVYAPEDINTGDFVFVHSGPSVNVGHGKRYLVVDRYFLEKKNKDVLDIINTSNTSDKMEGISPSSVLKIV